VRNIFDVKFGLRLTRRPNIVLLTNVACVEFSPNGDYFVYNNANKHVCMKHMQPLLLYVCVYIYATY
jgi:hypothetical protein